MTTSVTIIGGVIEGEVLIHTVAERVFHALTAAEELMRWWGSKETYEIRRCEVDLREGGVWSLEAQDVGGRPFSISARILRLDPPHLLELSWATSWAPDDRSVVELSLTPEGEAATRLRVRHSGLRGGGTAGRDTHYWAWRSILDWAEQSLAAS